MISDPFENFRNRMPVADSEPAAVPEPATVQESDALEEPAVQVPEVTPEPTPEPESVPEVAPVAERTMNDREASRNLERRLLGGPRTLKRREVASGAGVSLLSAKKLWRALGFPNVNDEEVAFTERDLEAILTIVENVREGYLSEETAISITRSIGQMTDRMVIWQIEALVEDFVQNRKMTDREAREHVLELLPRLIEPIENVLLYTWRRQMNAAIQRQVLRVESGLLASAEGRTGEEDDAPLPLARAVGFADLVSYTSLSRRMNERTLAQLVQRFEQKSAEIIAVGGGRLVKTIGDEVLFVAETPQAGAEISLALAEEFKADEFLPDARVSLVWGRVLSRLGDIYGPTVNLAARLTALAKPSTVLCDALTASTLSGDKRYIVERQQSHEVRGFGEITPYILARGEGEGLSLD